MALEITDANFDELVLKSSKPVMVDFWAEWCGPCRMLGPIIEEVSKDYEGKAVVGKLDVDSNQEFAAKFGVRNIPTVLVFKDGELVKADEDGKEHTYVFDELDEYYVDIIDENEEYCPICTAKNKLEEKKGKCTPSKGKRFAKRVNGKCRSYGQAGKAKKGGDRIRPGTKKGDAYCARSAKIKKCKNPPCANALSRKKWKCQGSRSVVEAKWTD